MRWNNTLLPRTSEHFISMKGIFVADGNTHRSPTLCFHSREGKRGLSVQPRPLTPYCRGKAGFPLRALVSIPSCSHQDYGAHNSYISQPPESMRWATEQHSSHQNHRNVRCSLLLWVSGLTLLFARISHQHSSIFHSFFLFSQQHVEFLGQGSDPSCSCDQHHSYGNARSLTHCAGPGSKPATWQRCGWSHCATAGTPSIPVLLPSLSSLQGSPPPSTHKLLLVLSTGHKHSI